jgi:tRNA-specific 2-thiouridylase
MMSENKSTLIAMSGGVDSSVAALLMQEAGYECIGTTLRLFDNEDTANYCAAENCSAKSCCSLEDVDYARQVCARLDIPFYVFDFSADFRTNVMDRFVSEYEKARTPNPCIDCNRFIKFDRLHDRMREIEFQTVTTGHYARVKFDAASGRYQLLRGVDHTKDQSYVLYALTQNQLAHTSFPLGELTKSEVRKIAEAHGFANAKKADSQDICFVPDGRYADFIEHFTKRKYPHGNFVDIKGNIIGTHEGLFRYTIGQRKGLGKAFGKPMYVVELKPETNEVVLGEEGDLLNSQITINDINLISTESIPEEIHAQVKIRYSQDAAGATMLQTGADEIKIKFDKPARAATPGQAAVIYDGDVVIGGGTISRVQSSCV